MSTAMTDAEIRRLLADERVGRLATADAGGRPHVVPAVFALSRDRIFLPIDHKPKRSPSPESLRRVIRQTKPGEKVVLSVVRAGQPMELTVVVDDGAGPDQ